MKSLVNRLVKKSGIILVGALFMFGLAGAVYSADDPAPAQTLDDKVQSLKKEVMQLNRDLFILEEELLFPASTQVAVFLATDVGNFFKLDSVELKIDDKVVTNYLYTQQEVEALSRGGVQRLYVGNIKKGKRELVAVFRGPGPNGREYKRGTTYVFEKGSGTKYIELKITDKSQKLQPEFVVKEWE